MNNSKLLQTLRALTSEEIQRLAWFLHSPYFQKEGISEDEVRLLDYLHRWHPEYPPDKVDKKTVFRTLYPDQALVKGKLEKKMSALLNQVQRFIIQERWEEQEEPVRRLLYLAEFYKDRALQQLYKRTFGRIQKLQADQQQRDETYFFNEFLVQNEIAEYQSLHTTRKDDLNLPNTLRSLDVFYLAKKLEYFCGLLAQSKPQIPIEIQEDLNLLRDLNNFQATKSYWDIPLIKAYFKAFSFLQDRNDTQAYTELKDLLRRHRDDLSVGDLKALKAFCRNFSVYQFNKGNQEYLQETFQLYREDLREGFLYYEGGLMPSTIRNMVSIGLKRGEYDWVLQLLEDHKDRIVGTKFPKDVYYFNLANCYFELKDYGNSLKYLADHYDDLYYQIAAKRLEIKVYYEEDSDLLEPKLDAFKVFIYRLPKNKFPELPRLGNKNFFNALRQIINPQTRYDTKRVERLIAKIKNQQVLVEKDWLLEKLCEL